MARDRQSRCSWGQHGSAGAGRFLARLALGPIALLDGRTCVALRGGHPTWPDPSLLTRGDDLADAMWQDSARLAGLISWVLCAGAGAEGKGVPP